MSVTETTEIVPINILLLAFFLYLKLELSTFRNEPQQELIIHIIFLLLFHLRLSLNTVILIIVFIILTYKTLPFQILIYCSNLITIFHPFTVTNCSKYFILRSCRIISTFLAETTHKLYTITMVKAFRPSLEPPADRHVRVNNYARPGLCVIICAGVASLVLSAFAASGWNIYSNR